MFGGIREILPEVSHTGEQVRLLILALPRFMGPNLGRGGRREGQEEGLFISPLQQRALWENTLHCSSHGGLSVDGSETQVPFRAAVQMSNLKT